VLLRSKDVDLKRDARLSERGRSIPLHFDALGDFLADSHVRVSGMHERTNIQLSAFDRATFIHEGDGRMCVGRERD